MSNLTMIGRIPRNDTEELRVYYGIYWGKEVIDIRWYSDGKPSRKGVRFNMEEAPHVINLLEMIMDGKLPRSKKDNKETKF